MMSSAGVSVPVYLRNEQILTISLNFEDRSFDIEELETTSKLRLEQEAVLVKPSLL